MYPTYLENRAARRLIARASVDARTVSPTELAAAHATIRARSQYLSERQRASPKYRSKAQRSQARKINDPLAFAHMDAQAHIEYLQRSDDPRASLVLAALVELIVGF